MFEGKRVVLLITDLFCSHYTLTHANRTFQFRYDTGRASRFVRREDGKVSLNTFGECGYRMIDRFDHDAEAAADVVIFQLSRSGMALRYGESDAHVLTPLEWREYAYLVFSLAEDFTFDAIFVVMGTNDLKLLSQGGCSVKKPKVVVDGELRPEVLPSNIGQFVDSAMKHTMVGFSKAFGAPACWFGGGFGGTPASQFTSPGNERLIASVKTRRKRTLRWDVCSTL
jgi:hypothetical protein